MDALAHSYTGLYGWAIHHRLDGWQAWSWPAEIDVFLVVGELALYVAYLDAWPDHQRRWPWITAIIGLVVSVIGNIGHIQPLPGAPVTTADRLTAAVSPIAAFAGLIIGLLVLKMNGRQRVPEASAKPALAAVGDPRGELLADAAQLLKEAQLGGRTLTQRALAVQLRERGHRFSNQSLRDIARTVSAESTEDVAA
jgi:hypothetical protein